MIDVVTMGETMGTVRLSGLVTVGTTVTPSIAGSESNVAIGLARLGYRAAWVGCVGPDSFGDGILRLLRGEGVMTEFIERRDAPTGLLVSRPAGLGNKAVDYHRSGSAGRQLSLGQVDAALADAPRYLHLSGITPALGDAASTAVDTAIAKASEQGTTICFDINYRSRLWDEQTARTALSDLARQADIVIGGTQELQLVTGESDPVRASAVLVEGGVSEVVWKEARAAAVTTAVGSWEVPGLSVPVVDTIGAGDAFTAGYLSGRIDELDSVDRLKRAHLAGAFVVGMLGDWEGLPTRDQVLSSEAQFASGTFDAGDVAR